MLVPDRSDGRAPQSLIRCASLYLLENMMRSEGKDPSILWRSSDDWSEAGSTLDGWIEQATDSLSVAIVSAISVIDFEAGGATRGFAPSSTSLCRCKDSREFAWRHRTRDRRAHDALGQS